MAERRIKTGLMLIGEALVIWYGMGTPVPTNLTDGVKLVVAVLAIVYTGWKNHDFTIEGAIGTLNTRELKEQRDVVPVTADEPDDAEVVLDEDE